MKIFQQVGFRDNWNISLLTEGVGDGLVLAPRYQKQDLVLGLDEAIRRESLFDPQFFLPATARGTLSTYNFFPEIVSGGFETADYDDSHAQSSADLCIAFQASCGFRYWVIPTRLLEGAPPDFIDLQSQLFVTPFLESARRQTTKKPILLQLILTDVMLKDPAKTDEILNWATGLADLAGVYLIPYLPQRQKQIQDPELLFRLLRFVAAFRKNKMEVLIGYLNTEALLLLAADPTGVATGTYENLRMFSPKAFEDTEKRPQQGPAARIFSSTLLQWVDNRYLGAVRRELEPENVQVVDGSPYAAELLDPSYNWHFSKADPYKHYLYVFTRLLQAIGSIAPGAKRIAAIRTRLLAAHSHFQLLDERGVFLDDGSNGAHLAPWITALNQFERLP